jgi:CheY-like chemotaxis protein
MLLPRRILIVEDNPVNQKVLHYLITGQGFQAEIAANGVKALDAFKPDQFVLIFMDLRMPLMDGFETTRELRKSGCEIPIIAITASEQEDDRIKSVDAGMDGFLTKPFNKLDFDGVLKQWLI